MKKIILILMLLVCIIPIASAANFVWYPTTATDYHSYQGERIQGWVDNADADSISIIGYTWNDGITTQSLIYARGYIISGTRECGAAYYPYLPADGQWWKSNDGGSSWVSSSFSEIYSGTIYAGRDEAFYAGYPNHADDLKTNSLTIDVYNMNPVPSKIDTDTYTYYVKRLYPYVYTTGESDNPHVGGTDVASQTLQFNTTVSDYSVYTIDHYYINEADNPIMGTRYIKKWDSATRNWLDTYWRQTLDSGTWSALSGDYTWLEAFTGAFSTLEEGNYTLKTDFYDYKGRSHYNVAQERNIIVTSSLDYYQIYFKEYPSGNAVTSNVYITIKKLDDTILFQGYLQGTYHEMSFNSPTTLKISATADGYSPKSPTIQKTFTSEDHELTYEFLPIQDIERLTNYHDGNLRFLVREAGTYNPLANAKVTIHDVAYYTDASGMITISLPATEGESKVQPFSFGDTGSGTYRLFGDWNGDGIDTAATFKNGDWKLASANIDGGGTVNKFSFGRAGDIPIVGDWDGDGIDTVGLFRGNGNWYLGTSNTARGGNPIPFIFGIVGDIPVVGDWNGDGSDTIGIFRDDGSYSFILWYLGSSNEAGGGSLTYVGFGAEGDLPLIGSWNGDAYDTVGVKRGRVFFLADSLDIGSIRSQYFELGADDDYRLYGDVIGSGVDKVGYYDVSTEKWIMPTGYYDYTVSFTGRPSISGTSIVFEGSTIPVNIIMPKTSTIPSTPFTERPEGEGVGFLQVLGYLMHEEGITEEEDQNAVLGMLIIVFAALMVGGLVAGGYGVLVGSLFGFVLSIVVGFIPIWIPISLIAIAGIYILMKAGSDR